MKRMTQMALLFLAMGLAARVEAGSQYQIACSNATCGFKTSLGMGGGFRFVQVTGFCKKCNKPAAITWNRDAKGKEPAVEFWDPATGETRRIYNCPDCGGPFVVIEKIEDFKCCPKCGKPTLTHKRTLMYD